MTLQNLTSWVTHLRGIAEPIVAAEDVSERSAIVEPFLAAIGESDDTPVTPRRGETPDTALWRSFTDPTVIVDEVIGPQSLGPLFPMDRYTAIEVWTESDLCGLHALWNLAELHDNDEWRARIDDVRTWHLENIQPDNATNRPWALHVFLLMGTPESMNHASILLHNCLAMHGRPDPLSARILLDGARGLERLHA